eukprot:6202590-Pleurochrysis_carterae.AAC.7
MGFERYALRVQCRCLGRVSTRIMPSSSTPRRVGSMAQAAKRALSPPVPPISCLSLAKPGFNKSCEEIRSLC